MADAKDLLDEMDFYLADSRFPAPIVAFWMNTSDYLRFIHHVEANTTVLIELDGAPGRPNSAMYKSQQLLYSNAIPEGHVHAVVCYQGTRECA